MNGIGSKRANLSWQSTLGFGVAFVQHKNSKPSNSARGHAKRRNHEVHSGRQRMGLILAGFSVKGRLDEGLYNATVATSQGHRGAAFTCFPDPRFALYNLYAPKCPHSPFTDAPGLSDCDHGMQHDPTLSAARRTCGQCFSGRQWQWQWQRKQQTSR